MGLTGGLGELPLADLVEMTALGSKTGRLTLTDEEGGVAGSLLSFRDGRLVAAACGPLADERGFYALLELKAGSFDFDPQAQLDEETCNLSTESLLMEGMRRIDEICGCGASCLNLNLNVEGRSRWRRLSSPSSLKEKRHGRHRRPRLPFRRGTARPHRPTGG